MLSENKKLEQIRKDRSKDEDSRIMHINECRKLSESHDVWCFAPDFCRSKCKYAPNEFCFPVIKDVVDQQGGTIARYNVIGNNEYMRAIRIKNPDHYEDWER